MPEWAPDYLGALSRAEGVLTRATQLIGKDYSTTYKARLAYPDFAKAVDEIRGESDSRHFSELENISIIQAMKPGNITKRIINLKALNPGKYREKKTAQFNAPIHITFGFQMPEITCMQPSDSDVEIQDAEFQETRKKRRLSGDTLSEDDLDI